MSRRLRAGLAARRPTLGSDVAPVARARLVLKLAILPPSGLPNRIFLARLPADKRSTL